ncbi:TetR/AcrR family transcriptional regulator [Sulfidibacter corallicola]|uniref:TetR/AcrR family transcriptional regulator n=1 Tax=Sulfidibacter corallicola TaxID=2818388 RepID=A0A8A4TM59_SULCO|nr:TetR/AcrR family transcriptional regulator [Sulfidibacter corallicola]QTD50643.1 TetR/AcrR family transcriptional regulator [Sulfidibacter corallicola]
MSPVEDKREAILAATLRLIARHGFHGTAMSKVAKEAGVSAGIIYHYFKNKDELIIELYRVVKRGFADALFVAIDPGKPLSVQIRELCALCFRYSLQHPREVTFLEQFTNSPYNEPAIRDEVERYFEPLLDCFERAKKEMIIKDLPPPVIGTLTVDVASSLARKQASGVLELDDPLIDRVVDALWEAIRR